MQAKPINPGLYPISTVSALTGVNAVTLRAWERRYGLVRPTRTSAGHRVYTETDVERIKTILKLLDEGIAISRVDRALQHAVVETEAPSEEGPWPAFQQAMLNAVANFDEAVLEARYNEAMSLYPVDVLTRRLLVPLMEQLGERWARREGSVAEEHFFSVFMRNKLGARFHHRNLQNTGPQLLAACIPGEQHEFGLLLFALAAHARGYRVILLGANMPLEELPDVIARTNSAGVVLSGSVDVAESALAQHLDRLTNAVSVPVFFGGTTATRHAKVIAASGVHLMGDDLVVGLRVLAQVLPTHSKTQTL